MSPFFLWAICLPSLPKLPLSYLIQRTDVIPFINGSMSVLGFFIHLANFIWMPGYGNSKVIKIQTMSSKSSVPHGAVIAVVWGVNKMECWHCREAWLTVCLELGKTKQNSLFFYCVLKNEKFDKRRGRREQQMHVC